MNKILNFDLIKLNTLLYIILIVGFTIISTFPDALSLNSRTVTLPFRAIVLVISLVIIINTIYTKKNNKFGKTEFFFVAFWVFYIIKAIISFKIYDYSKEIGRAHV